MQRATPNGDGDKKRPKTLQAPSPDALFRPRARFLSILGSRPDPKITKKTPPRLGFPILEAHFFDLFAFSSLGRVPEGSRTDSGGSGDAPGRDFGRFFGILRYVPT